MEPERSTPGAPRAGRVARLLAGAAAILAAGGAIWFARSASQVRRDPALVYRDRGTLDQLLKRANEAERAGDRGTAITAYRFVAAVAQGGGADLAPYVTAARAGLTRLGAPDTLPGPRR